MSNEVLPEFIHILVRTLTHWQERSQNLDDALIIEIDPERHNLHQAIALGLQLPQTCPMASEVALQTFYFAERKGYWSEWIQFFERALHHCPATEHNRRGRLLNRLGELYRFIQRIDEAIAMHKQAEALAQEAEDELTLAEARYRLCWDYFETRQYEAAEACSRSALETFARLGTRDDLLTNCYWALGSIARRQGHLAAAQEQLNQAALMAHTTQQPTIQARIIDELAMALQENGLYDEALACYNKALQLLAATASERDKAQIQLNQGLLYFRQQNWLAAEMTWRQAINSTYLRQSGESFMQARLAHNLGNVLLKQGNLSEAESQLNYARELRLELGDKLTLANTLGDLAKVYAQQGKRDEAVSLFKEALQLLTGFPESAWAQRLLGNIAAQLQALQSWQPTNLR